MSRSLFLLPVLGVFLCASAVRAQVGSSSITGLVQDTSGAVIPNAKVVAQNQATGATYETATSSSGTYTFASVPPGAYTITITQQGFRTFVSRGNVLTVGAPLVLDARLEVGAVAETVQVESSYERLETTHAMVSDVVTHKGVVELPLNGRNPLALIVLQPGLVQRTTNGTGSGTHVFGSRDRAHNVTVDGIEANESSVPNPQSNLHRLNPDNVQEYRVVTHNATPEFGRNSGANVAIATRSGTNEVHGDLFWFHRNTVLNANEWFNNVQGIERPTLLMNQFGFDVGGPIVKNRTFFFGSYQGNRIKMTQPISQAFSATPSVYSPSLKQGIFRYFVADPNNPLVLDGVTIARNSPRLVDPRTGALRPEVPLCGGGVSTRCVATYNIVGQDPLRLGGDPLITQMINTFPLPNTYNVGDGLNFAGFAWNPPSRFSGPHQMVRIDHRFSDNDNVFARALWSEWNTTEGDFLNSRPALFPGFAPLGEVNRTAYNIAASYRRVLTPRAVNELTAGFSRFHFFFGLLEANTKTGQTPPPYGQECFGTDSFRNIDTPFCNTPHTARAVNSYQLIDNFAYTRGAHTLRTGFNIRYYQHNDERGVPGGFNMPATIIFDRTFRTGGLPAATGINATDNNNLQNAIVELLGIPGRVQQLFVADPKQDSYISDLWVYGTRAKQYNFYVQDEWRARPSLTLTYGLRWELNTPPSDSHGRVRVPDKSVDGSQGPVTYVKADRWFDRLNATAIAPRLGVAWSPGAGRTVVRAGWGLAFDPISTFQVTSIAGKVPGSVLQCQVNVQDPASASPCTDVPNDIRLSELMRRFQPFTLGTPSVRPSVELNPPARPLDLAPNVGAFDPNLKTPTVHEWSLTIQRELPGNFVGQVGYIGKRGLRLLHAYDLNQIRTDQPGFRESFLIARDNMRRGCNPDGTGGCAGGRTPDLLLQMVPAATLNSTNFRNDIQRNGLGDIARRIDQTNIAARGLPANYFRRNPQFSELFYIDSGGTSIYHGLISQVRRRFSGGLEFGFSYTLSKSIDDMSVDPVGATSGGALSSTNSRTPTDVRNFRLDRAVSDFDNRHVVVGNAVWEVPLGRGRALATGMPGWADHIVGGWTLTGIYTMQSGEPFTVQSGMRTANGYKVSGVELVGPKPDTKLKFVSGIDGPVVFNVSDLDTTTNCRQVVGTESRFCIPEPGAYGIGRNSFRGPGFWNFDFGVLKNFGITERVRLQFRTEFFNVFNHRNFENPRNATEGSPTLTSALFGQTCCVSSALPSSSTIIATGEPNRVIQVALKLSF